MSGVEAYPILSYWHSTKPIYSCDFNHMERNSNKFLTCGGDSRIKIWKFKDVNENEGQDASVTTNDDITSSIKTHFQKAKDRINDVEYIATLKGFSKPVNVSKFSPCGKYIAGCGDDGYIIIWEKIEDASLEQYKSSLREKYFKINQEQQGFFIQSQLKNDIDKIINPYNFPIKIAENFNDEYEDEYDSIDDIKQLYKIIKYFPVTNLSANEQLEIYSLDWSPDSQYLVIGYMNTYIKVIDVNDSQQPYCVVKKNHNDVVQGCVWDPLNELIITMGADRAICIYKPKYTNNKITDLKLINRIVKGELVPGKQENIFAQVDFNFFRKLQFSPDGLLLVVPYGIYKNPNGDELNCCHIFHRANLLRGLNKPVAIIPNLKKRCLCISFNPNLYKRDDESNRGVFGLDYKMVFAIATDDEIMIYDTERLECLMIVKNLHYYPIYSMSWNSAGNKIIISSKDGFLSTIDFKSYKFGDYYKDISVKPVDHVESNKIEVDDIEMNDVAEPKTINVLQIRKKK